MTDDQGQAASPWGGAARLFDKVLASLNAIGSLWILFLLVLINADVFGRNVFTAPIDGVNEMVEMSIVAIVFLQLGDATRVGRMTRSDGFFNLMLRRSRRVGCALGALFDGLGALFLGFILYGTWPLFIEAYEKNYYAGNEGVFTAPTWPVKLIVVIGCGITMLLLLSLAWRYLRHRGAGTPHGGEVG